ncbi:hypothetical protein JTB14_037352 [Gonioctena quinquepunctata]|nr:hypothetical protein JTB14_037352 [Gonioctena quinquepunctata]
MFWKIVEKPEEEPLTQGKTCEYFFGSEAILSFKLEMERMKLKRRLSVLQYTLRIQVPRIAAVIISCAVLHNISKRSNNDMPDGEVDQHINADQQEVAEEEYDLENTDAALRRR